MSTDRIQKQVLLPLPRERVWRAIADSTEFGTWFGARFDGPFVEGARVGARIVPTAIDAEVAASQKPYEGMAFDILVERVEPLQRLAFRWHPGAQSPPEGDPMTLVTFELEDAPGGTRLTITESGFDALPLERRAKAFADNEGGWEAQSRLIAKYLAAPAGG